MTNPNNIRNFVIIAHIDHGKSTLADRFLELTKTIDKRKMKEQYLDRHPLEKERGITIKMQPVTMFYKLKAENYTLNLIDTPGHVDFSYEVSRALAAVEGAVLLVDATQGTQAQTLSNFELAKRQGLKIIPAINKIDLPQAEPARVKEEMADLFGFKKEEIILISAKTGENVDLLLEEIVKRVPPPKTEEENKDNFQALIFDYEYSPHHGVIAYARVLKGEIKKGDEAVLIQAGKKFKAGEVGIFRPHFQNKEKLSAGEIGYLVTKIKNLEGIRVGDNITLEKTRSKSLVGYQEPKPMIFANIYPAESGDFNELANALSKLRLLDNSFVFEPDQNPVIGKGFKAGFLGTLHFEIILERLKREFGQEVITSLPSVLFEVLDKNGRILHISSPSSFPDSHEIIKTKEPILEIEIIFPAEYIGGVFQLIENFQGEIKDVRNLTPARVKLVGILPLREFINGFFDKLKSSTKGYASLNYKIAGSQEADLVRLDILVNQEVIPSFARVVPKEQSYAKAKEMVERISDLMPKALFSYKTQAKVGGKILASREKAASRKDVTGYLYGGDRTRKMKLWQKQKKGKKRLREFGKVNIPREVFLKMSKI